MRTAVRPDGKRVPVRTAGYRELVVPADETASFDAAEEAGMSRIYGGIHFHSANVDGLQAGSNVGEWTVTHYLLPKGNRSR